MSTVGVLLTLSGLLCYTQLQATRVTLPRKVGHEARPCRCDCRLLHVCGTTRIIPNPCRNPLYRSLLEHELEQNNDLPEGGKKKPRPPAKPAAGINISPRVLIYWAGEKLLTAVISSAIVSHSPLQHVLLLGSQGSFVKKGTSPTIFLPGFILSIFHFFKHMTSY